MTDEPKPIHEVFGWEIQATDRVLKWMRTVATTRKTIDSLENKLEWAKKDLKSATRKLHYSRYRTGGMRKMVDALLFANGSKEQGDLVKAARSTSETEFVNLTWDAGRDASNNFGTIDQASPEFVEIFEKAEARQTTKEIEL